MGGGGGKSGKNLKGASTETVLERGSFHLARPLGPFADLIYGPILTSKNTAAHRSWVPPREFRRFLAFPEYFLSLFLKGEKTVSRIRDCGNGNSPWIKIHFRS